MCIFLVIAHTRDMFFTVGAWLPLAIDRTRQYQQVRVKLHRLQFKLMCCGVNSFQDWLDHKQSLNELKNVNYLVPFSCCNHTFPGPCIRISVNDNLNLMRRTIYNQGCRSNVEKSLRSILNVLTALQITVLVIQLVALIVAKVLHTNLMSSQYEQDPTASSPAWIFNNGLNLNISHQSSIQYWLKQVENTQSENFIDHSQQKYEPLPNNFIDDNEVTQKFQLNNLVMNAEETQRRKVRASLVRKAKRNQR